MLNFQTPFSISRHNNISTRFLDLDLCMVLSKVTDVDVPVLSECFLLTCNTSWTIGTHKRWLAWPRGLMRQLSDCGLNLPDKRVDPGCWLKSGFEFPQGQLVISLFTDPVSYGRFTSDMIYMCSWIER